MPFEAVAVATALAAAIFTLLMGLLTNLPFALASGPRAQRGRRVRPDPRPRAAVAGGDGVRRDRGPDRARARARRACARRSCARSRTRSSSRSASASACSSRSSGSATPGITVNNAATGIGLGVLTGGAPLIALAGLLVMIVLTARGFSGAILVGILASTALGPDLRRARTAGQGRAVSRAASDFSTIGDALAPDNLLDALTWALVPVIFVLFVSDFFDTIGTAVAVSSAGGLLDEDGQPPRLKRLLLVDSAAAAGGGAMGVSSVTTYVESGAGVAEGARTGLASLVTAVCFLLTIFFVPLIAVVGQTVIVGEAAAAPGRRPRADHDRLPDDPARRRHRLVAPGGRHPRLPRDRRRAADVLDQRAASASACSATSRSMVAIGRAREVHPLMWALVPLFVAFFASDWLTRARLLSASLQRGRAADKTAQTWMSSPSARRSPITSSAGSRAAAAWASSTARCTSRSSARSR